MTAVATRDESPAGLIETYKADFALVLPSHIKMETWVRLAQGALRRDAKLKQAAINNPGSLIFALMEAARLGLEPGTTDYYLTPRSVKAPSGGYQDEILGIVGYRGEIELIYRAGAVSSVIAQAVYSGDTFDYVPGVHDRPQHVVDWFGDRGNLMGAYAYAQMKDGATSRVIVIGPKDIKLAKASSKGSDSQYSPWVKHEEAMYLKTAIHRLAKFVPTSAERVGGAPVPYIPPAPGQLPDLPADVETGEILEGEIEDGS